MATLNPHIIMVGSAISGRPVHGPSTNESTATGITWSQELTLMLAFDSMDPSPTTGGFSKEVGPSSSVNGELGRGLVGVGVEEGAPEAELGEGSTGKTLKPGLFGEGPRAPGERTRLAWSGEREREREVRLMSV